MQVTGEETGTETSALAADSAPAAGTSDLAPRKRDRRGKKRRKNGRRRPTKTRADGDGGVKKEEATTSGLQDGTDPEGEVGREDKALEKESDVEGPPEDGGELEERERGKLEGPGGEGRTSTAEKNDVDELGARGGILQEGGDAEKGPPERPTGQGERDASSGQAAKDVVGGKEEGDVSDKGGMGTPLVGVEGPETTENEATGVGTLAGQAGGGEHATEKRRVGGKRHPGRFGARKKQRGPVGGAGFGAVETAEEVKREEEKGEIRVDMDREETETGAADLNGEALAGPQFAGGRAAVEEWTKVERGSTGGLVLRLKLGVRSGGSSQRGDSKSEFSNGRKRDGSEVQENGGGKGHEGNRDGKVLADSNGVEKRAGKERTKRQRTNGATVGMGGDGLGAGEGAARVVEGRAEVDVASTRESAEGVEVETVSKSAKLGDLSKEDEEVAPLNVTESFGGKGLKGTMPEKDTDLLGGTGTDGDKEGANVVEVVSDEDKTGQFTAGRHPPAPGTEETRSHDGEGQKPASKSRRARSRMRP